MPAFHRAREHRHVTTAAREDRTLFNQSPYLEVSNVEVNPSIAANYCAQRFNLDVLSADVREFAKDSEMRIREFINAANEHQAEISVRCGVRANVE